MKRIAMTSQTTFDADGGDPLHSSAGFEMMHNLFVGPGFTGRLSLKHAATVACDMLQKLRGRPGGDSQLWAWCYIVHPAAPSFVVRDRRRFAVLVPQASGLPLRLEAPPHPGKRRCFSHAEWHVVVGRAAPRPARRG
jgi:hypothetical protein